MRLRLRPGFLRPLSNVASIRYPLTLNRHMTSAAAKPAVKSADSGLSSPCPAARCCLGVTVLPLQMTCWWLWPK
jgi:hypothetical protein